MASRNVPSTSRGKGLTRKEIEERLHAESSESESDIEDLSDLYEEGEEANYSSSDSDEETPKEPRRLISQTTPGDIFILEEYGAL